MQSAAENAFLQRSCWGVNRPSPEGRVTSPLAPCHMLGVCVWLYSTPSHKKSANTVHVSRQPQTSWTFTDNAGIHRRRCHPQTSWTICRQRNYRRTHDVSPRPASHTTSHHKRRQTSSRGRRQETSRHVTHAVTPFAHPPTRSSRSALVTGHVATRQRR